jgi:glycosyltransferase involved in cell wall biosynthesis
LAAVIPALSPREDLIALVYELHEVGFAPLIVIDDGSDDSCSEIFEVVAGIPDVDVLRHAVKLGRGRALKTGFNHFHLNYPDAAGVVTINDDGRHSPEDALAVGEMLLRNPQKLILGCRPLKDVSWTMKLGNILTRSLLRLFAGTRISEPQTGLRGISYSAITQLIALDSERYDFEVGMLVNSSKFSEGIVEQPIQTI